MAAFFRYVGILILGLGLITFLINDRDPTSPLRLAGIYAMTIGLLIVATSLILRPRPKTKEAKPEFTKFEVKKLPGMKLEDDDPTASPPP